MFVTKIVNEIEETQADKIDLSKPYVVLEKLDGNDIISWSLL